MSFKVTHCRSRENKSQGFYIKRTVVVVGPMQIGGIEKFGYWPSKKRPSAPWVQKALLVKNNLFPVYF
jgi:hypothetical protein